MRRIAWLLIGCGSLFALAPVAFGADSGTYSDRFDTQSYSGSNGNLAWNGGWEEVGESNGPGAGKVRVEPDTGCTSGHCLKISNALLQGNQGGAARYADTSVFTTAELSFDVTSETLGLGGGLGALTGSSLVVEVTTGGTWSVLYRGDLLDLLDGGASPVLSLDDYLSPGFGVRFLAQDLLGGEVLIDNVEITGLFPAPPPTTAPTTTTTSPKPTPPSSSSTSSSTTTTTTPTTSAPGDTRPTTTTTAPRTTTSEDRPGDAPTTSTTSSADDEPPVSPVDPTDGPPPPDRPSGLRTSEGGVQADAGGFSFTPVDLIGGHRSAVERITADWVSLAGLAMVVTGTSVLGVDRRRRRDPDPEHTLDP
ncbi:MAG TPA: hypothetical protein VF246_07355 [Acidimicrobiia bacterium]